MLVFRRFAALVKPIVLWCIAKSRPSLTAQETCLDPFEARRTFSSKYSRQTSFFQELAAANAEAARLKAEGAAGGAASTEDSRADPGAAGCQNYRHLQRLLGAFKALHAHCL